MSRVAVSAQPFVVAVDFDGVIHNGADREPGRRMGKPYRGAKEALDQMRRLGIKIVIHTVRANTDSDHIGAWLEFFEIPFDEIAPKLQANLYVDDRAVPFFGDWQHAATEIAAHYWSERGVN